MEAIYRNFWEKGAELTERNYQELKSSCLISKCSAILINHTTKSYWFTDKDDAEHIISLTQR